MKNDVITVRVCGLSLKDVLEKLGGMGRGQPVRAASIGDVFAERDEYKKYADFFKDYVCPDCQDKWNEFHGIDDEEDSDPKHVEIGEAAAKVFTSYQGNTSIGAAVEKEEG